MRLSSPVRLAASVAATCTLVLGFACGSTADPSEFASSGGASGGTSNGSSSDGTSNGGFGTTSGASGTSGTSGADSGPCFAPVDMYIVFDKSGSMGEPIGNGAPGDCNVGDTKGSKWCRGINALAGYLNSPSAKDQSAALQFFSGDDNVSCNAGTPYDKASLPATGYTVLPTTAFNTALNGITPGGGTPMEAAIRGLTKFTAANRTPGHVTIGILITDGDPQGCNTDIDDLKDLIDAHYTATKIRTYVIGMNGATFGNLEKLASGGGGAPHAATVGALSQACGNVTAPCHFWNVGDGNPAGFIQALAAIQEASDGCKPGGGTVNPPK